jgi:uncharacterized protein YbjT (DUF2867 family)
MRILVTGATGYVASRLIPALLEAGHEVRVTSRDPASARARHPEVEAIASDLSDPSSLPDALDTIEVAYYLVHSMSGDDFEEQDRKAARNFAAAAEAADVSRIVYLGGLGDEKDRLSHHLESRHEVGRILAEGGVQVIELRAAIIVGNGSAAFEMLRHLTERLPMMIAPRWLETKIQPLAERDLVRYLVEAMTLDMSESRVIEIGGTDVVTYRDMILGFAEERGLTRRVIGVPVLTPRLSSYWVNLVTPLPASIARPLIDGLRNEVVVKDGSSRDAFPEVQPMGYRAAVRDALDSQIEMLFDPAAPGKPVPGVLAGVLTEEHIVQTSASPATLAGVIGSIGGDARWYPLRWAWWVRGRLDDLFGGRGLKWERPDGDLEPGARVDWWTVEVANDDRLLLRAEMKVPGEAWLEWRIVPTASGSELHQTAYFRPRGLMGRAYWWLLWPFHTPIFKRMASRLSARAEAVTAKEPANGID